MILNKTGLAITVSAILFSGSLIANEIDDGNDNIQWTDSANTAIGLSSSFNDNSDNSTSLGVSDSFNDNSKTSNSSMKTAQSNNDNSDNRNQSDNRSYADSSTTSSNSFNDNSNYRSDSSSTNVDSFNQVHMDTDMVVASSSLMGGVTGASVIYATNADDTLLRVKNMNTLDGLAGAAGITTIAQNTGSNSLVQQSVTTNASVFTGGE